MTLGSLAVVLLAIPFQLMMLYGLAAMAAFWSWKATRGVSDHLFLIFGVVLPVSGWLLSLPMPVLSFVGPASLYYLYSRISARESAQAREQREAWAEDVERAEADIAADPANGAAWWAKAKLHDEHGEREQALEHYRKAHELSERLLPEPELREIEDRLGSPPGGPPSRLAGVEQAGLGIGLLYIFWNAAWAVELCGLMAFLLWFRPGAERRG